MIEPPVAVTVEADTRAGAPPVPATVTAARDAVVDAAITWHLARLAAHQAVHSALTGSTAGERIVASGRATEALNVARDDLLVAVTALLHLQGQP